MGLLLPNSRGCCFCYCSSCCGWWTDGVFCGLDMSYKDFLHMQLYGPLHPTLPFCWSTTKSLLNLSSTAYTAKLTWVRMRRSLQALPWFCRKLFLMTEQGAYMWTGLWVSSVWSAFWKNILENKALWKVPTNQNCSRAPVAQVHFFSTWTLHIAKAICSGNINHCYLFRKEAEPFYCKRAQVKEQNVCIIFY